MAKRGRVARGKATPPGEAGGSTCPIPLAPSRSRPCPLPWAKASASWTAIAGSMPGASPGSQTRWPDGVSRRASGLAAGAGSLYICARAAARASTMAESAAILVIVNRAMAGLMREVIRGGRLLV